MRFHQNHDAGRRPHRLRGCAGAKQTLILCSRLRGVVAIMPTEQGRNISDLHVGEAAKKFNRKKSG